ncbi:MAG: tRNA (N6-threonylcarbamoyladenosine(37)-N6)-methyltransferase TrmO [Geminicoccaceae bacterium]
MGAGREDDDRSLRVIGRIRTPWTNESECPRNSRASDRLCQVEVTMAYQAGLRSLETCSHVILLYWLHQAQRDPLVFTPPFANEPHGVFATRSPNRPNPIGLAVSRLVAIDEGTLTVMHVDCIDGTPLLDIKPYFGSTDCEPNATVGWFEPYR